MRKTFSSLLTVAFLVFVTISLGGCGGSSSPVGTNTDGGGGQGLSTELSRMLVSSDIASVMNGN